MYTVTVYNLSKSREMNNRNCFWSDFSDGRDQQFPFGRIGSFEEYKTAILNPPPTHSAFDVYQNDSDEWDFGHFYKPVGKSGFHLNSILTKIIESSESRPNKAMYYMMCLFIGLGIAFNITVNIDDDL